MDRTGSRVPSGTDARARVGAVIMARHGRPALDRDVRLNWREFRAWWCAYDEGGLAADQGPPEALLAAAAAADVIFSSALRRSIETARAAAQGRAIISDAVFNEAPLPPPEIPGRFSPGQWGVIARISWWLGRAREMESRAQAELRAQAAVATLTARALRGETVIVLAHGWFNRMMRPVMRAQGWRCVHDGGDGYWSFRRYERTGRVGPHIAADDGGAEVKQEEP